MSGPSMFSLMYPDTQSKSYPSIVYAALATPATSNSTNSVTITYRILQPPVLGNFNLGLHGPSLLDKHKKHRPGKQTRAPAKTLAPLQLHFCRDFCLSTLPASLRCPVLFHVTFPVLPSGPGIAPTRTLGWLLLPNRATDSTIVSLPSPYGIGPSPYRERRALVVLEAMSMVLAPPPGRSISDMHRRGQDCCRTGKLPTGNSKDCQ